MTKRGPIECWLTDMDGVLVHEGVPIPGANRFLSALTKSGKRFLVLTNNSIYTPRDLHVRLRGAGLHVPPEAIYTSAMATADFLSVQRPEGTAYVIGEAGLTTALHAANYVLTDLSPNYVVLGETRSTVSEPSPGRSAWSTPELVSSRPTRTRPAPPRRAFNPRAAPWPL